VIKCDNCGKKIKEETAYCPHCGYNIIPWTLDAGAKLHHGRYRVVQSLGTGGMASVYLAEDLNLDETPCVLKIMTDDFKDHDERKYAIQKFKDEAVMLARLRHTNLPVVQNHFIEEGRYFLVMDYVEGDTLEDIICTALDEDCLLDEETVIKWGFQICDVLDYLHNRDPMIIHRDIKTDNLMEQNDGTIKLLDFGVARIFNKKKTGTLVGTPGYASPEQYLGKAYPQSDIFALGVTLHRLLTGYDPTDKEDDVSANLFIYPPLSDFREDLSPGLQAVISRAMEMEVENRFISAKKFKEALVKIKEKPGPSASGTYASSSRLRESIIKFEIKDSSKIRELLAARGTNKPVLQKEKKPALFSSSFKLRTSMGLPVMKQRLSEIVALDIGSYEIKIFQMDIDGNGYIFPKIIASTKTPQNTVSKGIITDPVTLSKSLNAKTLKAMLKSEVEVVTCLSPYAISIRTVKLPSTPPEKLPSIMGKDIAQLIPLLPEDTRVDFEILLPSIPGDEKNMKVRVTGIRKSALQNLRKFLKLGDLNYDKIAIDAFAMSGLLSLLIQEESRKKNIAIINFGAEGTSLTFIRDEVLVQTLKFSFGGNKLTHVLMQSERVSYDKADELKKTRCDANIWTQSSGDNLFQVLMPHMKDWTTEILKAIRFFGPDYRLDKFESLIFTGGAFGLKNLPKHINSQLKIEAEKFILPTSKGSTMDKQIIIDRELSLMCCMGMAMSPFMDLNFIRDEEDGDKKKKGFLDMIFGKK